MVKEETEFSFTNLSDKDHWVCDREGVCVLMQCVCLRVELCSKESLSKGQLLNRIIFVVNRSSMSNNLFISSSGQEKIKSWGRFSGLSVTRERQKFNCFVTKMVYKNFTHNLVWRRERKKLAIYKNSFVALSECPLLRFHNSFEMKNEGLFNV